MPGNTAVRPARRRWGRALPPLAPCGPSGLAAVPPGLLLLTSSASLVTAACDYVPGSLLGLGIVVHQVLRARLRRTLLTGDLSLQLVGEVGALSVPEQFHRLLRGREIYAPSSARWGDPRAQLLTGRRGELAKPATLTALRLPEDPAALLAGHAAALDGHCREAARRFKVNAAVNVDAKGRLHVQALEAGGVRP